jgi:peptidoglycan/LPS O-acetylase OafA/YrhL
MGFWPVYPMNPPDWFLSAMVLFYLCFNKLQYLVKRYCRVTTVGSLVCSLAVLQIALLTKRICLLVVGGLGLGHFWAPARILSFTIGMTCGQAALHMELSESGERKLALYADLFLGGIFVGAFTLPASVPMGPLILFFGDAPLADALMGLIRTRTVVGRVFSFEPLKAFAPYTLALYMVHTPIIWWVRFIANHDVQTITDLWQFNYGRDLPCDLSWDHWPESASLIFQYPVLIIMFGVVGGTYNLLPMFCASHPRNEMEAASIPTDDAVWTSIGCDLRNRIYPDLIPFGWLFIVILSLVLAVLLTVLVHDPFQRWLNEYNAKRASSGEAVTGSAQPAPSHSTKLNHAVKDNFVE